MSQGNNLERPCILVHETWFLRLLYADSTCSYYETSAKRKPALQRCFPAVRTIFFTSQGNWKYWKVIWWSINTNCISLTLHYLNGLFINRILWEWGRRGWRELIVVNKRVHRCECGVPQCLAITFVINWHSTTDAFGIRRRGCKREQEMF